jgi:RND family efflux transporter MFP subunit
MLPASRLKRSVLGAVLLLAAAAAAVLLWRDPAPAGKPVGDGIRPGVPVLVATVERRDVPHRIASIGTVQSLHSVVIRPQINGILTEVLFREGDLLPRGAPLARIDDRSIAAALAQAEAERASRAAQLRSAEADLARYGSLGDTQVISRQQIDQQAAMVERLKAELLASEATIAAQRVQLSHTRIFSPVAGRVGIRRVDPGNFVQTSDDEGLVTVTQIDPISIVFTLPQEALSRVTLTPGQSGAKVSAFDRAGGVTLGQGSITTFDNQIDPASGTLRLRAQFDNADGKLWPGQFVALELQAGMSANALVFPARAVQQGLNGPFVFRIRDSKAEVVPLDIVYEDDEITAVASGLEPGDTVVVDGQSRLKAGTVVRLPDDAGVARGSS